MPITVPTQGQPNWDVPLNTALNTLESEVSTVESDANIYTDTQLVSEITRADNTYLKVLDDLADISNPAAGRTNLGLGNSAVRNIGTTTGTVTAGDDSRFDGNPFLSLSNGGTVAGTVTHTGSLTVNNGNISVDIAHGLSTAINTGLVSGGQLTVNGSNPAAVDIAGLVGYIVDYTTVPTIPTVFKLTLGTQTVALTGSSLTRVVTWWLISSSGTIIQQATQPTPEQRRSHIQLGVTAYNSIAGVIFNVQSTPVIDSQPSNQLYDLMYSLGPFSINGNDLTPNGINLSFDKAVGTLFSPSFNYASGPANPHVVASGATTAGLFRYATQIAGSESVTQTTVLDVANYDLNGVITLIPGGANTSSIHRVFLFATNLPNEQLAVQYGQQTFSSLSTAAAAAGSAAFTINPDFIGIGTMLGYICATKSATDLSDPTQATFIPAVRFAIR